MSGGKRSLGFTILETMIVLAVSGALFVAVAVTISGREGKTQFQQAIQDVRFRIQQTMNEVANGFFPGVTGALTVENGLNCGTTGSQGEHASCIFLGKAIQFAQAGTDPEQANVFTIAGRRQSGQQEVTSLAAATPGVVTNAGTITSFQLQYGLTTAFVKYNGSAPITNLGAIAFVKSLASYNANNVIQSGAQQLDVIPIPSSRLGQTQAASELSLRNDLLLPATVKNPAGLQLCFASGTTNQSGLISIGSNGGQLAVTLDIKSNKTCQ